MAILELDGVKKRFDERYALHEVSFGLEAGDVLCFLGPSGCGKTTLLRIIAGLEQADSGTVSFDGQSLGGVPSHKRNFGMMFQEYALFPHMTVAQNVAFGLNLRKLPQHEIDTRIAEMLELVGLAGFAERSIGELSGGERQRVALARSLAPQPRLLMLDEPLAALDRGLRERLARDLRSILKAVGVTAVFVTHDQAEAFAIADKIAVFFDGKLEQLDTPEQVYTNPANETVARFLGFRNIVSGVGQQNEVTTGVGSFSVLSSSASSEKGKVLIRPEGARVLCDTNTPLGAHEVAISGTVTERTFLGQNYQLYLSCGQNESLRFFLPLSPTPPEIDQSVTIAVPQSSIVMLGEGQVSCSQINYERCPENNFLKTNEV